MPVQRKDRMKSLDFDSNNKIGVLKYDHNLFKLAEYFKSAISQKFNLPMTNFTLDTLNEHIDYSKLPLVYEALYGVFEDSKIYEEYYSLLQTTIMPYYSNHFFIQSKPAIRIHYPGARTVQYHSDEWYGHGPEVFNFWLPLTKAENSNSLYVASIEDSAASLKYLETKKAIQPEIDDYLRKFCQPLSINNGDIYCFNSKIIHGSEINETPFTRVSVDFRLLHPNKSSGTKKLNEFYLPFHDESLWPHKRKANNVSMQFQFAGTAYIYPSYGFTKFFSAFNQRDIVKSYAKKNQIEILAEETEIHIMPHHPTLKSLVSGYPNKSLNCVVAFSTLCLPESTEDRLEIYKKSIDHNIPIFFALENISIGNGPDDNIERIEAARDKYLK